MKAKPQHSPSSPYATYAGRLDYHHYKHRLARKLGLTVTVLSIVAGTGLAQGVANSQAAVTGGTPQQQAWLNESKLPVPPAVVATLTPSTTECVYAGGATARACSIYGETFYTPQATRYDLYYETAHLVDWMALTDQQRAYIAWDLRLGKRAWQDSAGSIAAGYEDGIEGVFPEVWARCAFGKSVKGVKFQFTPNGSPVAGLPVADPRTNLCTYLAALTPTPAKG